MQQLKDSNTLTSGIISYMQLKCKGKSNSVTSKQLEQVFGTSGEYIRKVINGLRSNGFPICSDNHGYYYANTVDEVKRTIDSLSSRKQSLDNAIYGLQNSLKTKMILPESKIWEDSHYE